MASANSSTADAVHLGMHTSGCDRTNSDAADSNSAYASVTLSADASAGDTSVGLAPMSAPSNSTVHSVVLLPDQHQQAPEPEELQHQATNVTPADEAAPIELPALPSGLVFVVADDNPMARILSKKNLRSANSHSDSIILGETLAEAQSVADKITQLAQEHGQHRVIGLLDQDLDTYADGSIYGSDICRQLRDQGFQGVICVRTGNANQYKDALHKAGVDLVVSKSVTEWPFRRVMQDMAALLQAKQQ